MFDSILRVARDAAIILLAVEGLAVCLVTLVLAARGLRQLNRFSPRVKPAVHRAAEAVLRVSAGTRRISQRATNATVTLRGAPSGLRAGLLALLRSKHKETTRE